MINTVGGFVSGVALSSIFVFNMNDVIYAQLRRNLILPIKHKVQPPEQQEGPIPGE